MRPGRLAVAGAAILLAILVVLLLRSGDEGLPSRSSIPADAPAVVPPTAVPPAPAPTGPLPAVQLPAPPPDPGPPADPAAGEDEVQGRVLSPAGQPLEGIAVRALAKRVFEAPTGGLAEEREERASATDAGGCFRVGGLRRDLPHTLVVEAEARGRLVVDFDPRPGSAGIVDLGDLVLPAVRALSGIAFDRPGEPLPGAVVRARGGDAGRDRFRPGKPPAVGTVSLLRRETRADDRGRFRFEGLVPGDYEMTLVVPGGVDVESVVTVPADRDLSGVELVASPGASVAFRVVDESGAPVQGISIVPRGPGKPEGLEALSDAEGWAALRGLPAIPLSFSIQEPAEFGKEPRFAKEEVGPFVPAGQEVAVVLRVPAPLRGVVVDAAGNPLDGMHVDILEDGRRLYSLTAICDGEGKFRVDLAPGRTVELRVAGTQGKFVERTSPAGKLREWKENRETLQRGSLGPVTAPADGLVLRCREIAKDRTLTVRVQDPEGRPIAGVELHFRGVGSWAKAQTDSAGNARCEGMVADLVSVYATAHPAEVSAKDLVPPEQLVVLPEGQTVEIRYRRGIVVQGIVKGADGRPASGAKVSIGGTGSTEVHPRASVADAEGRFRIACMPELRLGEVKAFWTSPEGVFHLVERSNVLAGPGPLELVVRPPLR